MDDRSVKVFAGGKTGAGNTRELGVVAGSMPPVHFHALIAETGKTI